MESSGTSPAREGRLGLDLTALRNGRSRRLVLAQLTSAVGDGIVIAVLPFAILAIGGTETQFGIALAVQALAMAAFFLPAGVIGDRLNRRAVVVASDLLRAMARGAIAVLLISGDASFWLLLAAQAVHGAGSALFYTSMDGLVPEAIDNRDLLRRTNALRFIALSLGMTVGPAVGGVLYATAGAGFAFGLDAITFLISAALICRLPRCAASGSRTSTEPWSAINDVVEGWRAFRSIGWYWRVALEFAVLNTLVFAPYFVIGPQVAEQSLGGAGAWAAILVALGAGELLGGLTVMSWEPPRPLQTATALVGAWILPLALLAALAPIGLLIAGAATAGAASAVFSAVWETAKHTHTPAHLRARLGSFDHLGSLGLVPFGYLFGVAMLGLLGASLTLAVGAVIVALATIAVAADPRIRSLGAEPTP